MNYLTDKVFNTYFSGVPNGQIIFREKKAVMCSIDRRTRVQLKEAPILPREPDQAIAETMIDYEKLYRELDAYVSCPWDASELTLANGAVYSRYITYTGMAGGKEVTAQLWAQRKSHGCIDVLTVDGQVIGFVNPGRICSEITVLAGYEAVTPLSRFNDPLLSKVESGVEPLGNIMVPCRDGTRLATEVFLPEGLEPGQKVPAIVIRTCYGKARDINGDGRISLAPAGTGTDTYLYDPEFPCGGEGDEFDDGLVCPYKCNSRQIRSDVLVYDTPVLEQDVDIAGPLYAELYAASSAVDTDFIVRVSDVDEEGIVRNVSFNIIRAEFRKGWDKPELLTPGKVEKYEMEMYFYGMVFKKGHRIRIDVSSSELMESFPNTNTGIDPYTDPDPIKAAQTIYHGKDYPSHVKLPVLYGL